VILRRVSDRDSDHLRFLTQIGLVPGTSFQVTSRDEDGACEIVSAGKRHVIPAALANGMQVERT
jgi:hypothetical protein